MVINEIKDAVIDIVNFIIPPCIKAFIFYFAVSYFTHGYLPKLWLDAVAREVYSLDMKQVNALFTELNLRPILPICFILVLVVAAYAVNAIVHFIGSLMPIQFNEYITTFSDTYQIMQIWPFFPK